jgi:hypothetical protein
MNDELWIRDVLQDLSVEMGITAVECFRSMFQIECIICEPWAISQRLEGRFDYVFSLNSSNERFKATMCVGIALKAMSTFLGFDVTLDQANDAFCEFGNVYCGMIVDNKKFSDQFGILIQQVPEEALRQAFFPEAWSVGGMLQIGDERMYIGYSIGKNRYEQEN